MSYGDDYGNRSYPGGRAPPPDLTEEAQFEGLGPRDGDEQARRPRYPNARWGATVLLQLGKSTTLVVTPLFDDPWPIGFQLRFSLDGITYSATMPANAGIDVTLTKSFDPKAGPAREVFPIDPGQTQPMCQVIARSLTITARTAETAIVPIYIQAVACRLTALDCEAVIPTPPMPTGFTAVGIARFPAQTATATQYLEHPRRAMFTIVNQSAANLYVALGGPVSITPGSENASIVLPPSSYSAYSILNFRGTIFFRFDADDAGGYALVSEGTYPP